MANRKPKYATARRLKSVEGALASMVESYRILVTHSPLSKNDIAVGVIRGAFIGAIGRAEALLEQHAECGS